MRFRGEFPARVFLSRYPDEFVRFLHRVKEMGDTGTIALRNHGHALKGPYRDLFQFKMELTRSWGFRVGSVFVVLHAAKKRTTGQEADYEKALALREDYLTGPPDD